MVGPSSAAEVFCSAALATVAARIEPRSAGMLKRDLLKPKGAARPCPPS